MSTDTDIPSILQQTHERDAVTLPHLKQVYRVSVTLLKSPDMKLEVSYFLLFPNQN